MSGSASPDDAARAVRRVHELLTPETIGPDTYRMPSEDIGTGRVFGGQVLAQALAAACETVDLHERAPHSLHAYFLKTGDHAKPIEFHVDRQRDGRSYVNRRVVAMQDGQRVLNLAASFQRPESGPDHQAAAPAVAPPQQMTDIVDLVEAFERMHPDRPVPRWLTHFRPFDFRLAQKPAMLDEQPAPAHAQLWFRLRGPVQQRPAMQQCLLAYVSDLFLLAVSLRPHQQRNRRFSLASLDHAMWFQRPFDCADWLLYDIESPTATGGRGLSIGRIFDRHGTLVALTVQEGVTRIDDRGGA